MPNNAFKTHKNTRYQENRKKEGNYEKINVELSNLPKSRHNSNRIGHWDNNFTFPIIFSYHLEFQFQIPSFGLLQDAQN